MKKILLLILLPLTIFSQTNWCDSISFSVLPNPNGVFSVAIETTDSLDNFCDTVDVAWAVCNMDFCFNGFGAFYSFPIIQTTDTVKVCYNAYIMNPPDPTISCYDVCEWIIYNGVEWVPLSNTVGWEEILPNGQHVDVAYDLKGKVVHELKKNTIYIRNMKKFIQF